MPITVAPDTKAQLAVFLKRSETWKYRSIGDSEKRVGIDLPAPAQLSPANNAMFDHYPRMPKLEWSPVEVDPQPLDLKNNLPMSGIVDTSYKFYFVGANPGRWRVRAVDKEGREGFVSPWRRFVYLQ